MDIILLEFVYKHMYKSTTCQIGSSLRQHVIKK